MSNRYLLQEGNESSCTIPNSSINTPISVCAENQREERRSIDEMIDRLAADSSRVGSMGQIYGSKRSSGCEGGGIGKLQEIWQLDSWKHGGTSAFSQEVTERQTTNQEA